MRSLALVLFLCSCAPEWQPNPELAADVSCQAHGGTCGGGFFGGCPSGNWRVDDSLSCSTGPNYLQMTSCCFPSDAGPDVGISLDEAGPADATGDRHDDAAFDASADVEDGGELDAPADVAGDSDSG